MSKNARLLARSSYALLAVCLGACNIVPSASVTPRYGMLDVEGDLFLSSSGASASSNEKDLGLDDDGVLSPRVDFSWGVVDVMASGFSAGYEGTGTAQGQFDLGGVVIMQNDDVRTMLDLKQANLLFTFDVVPTDLVDLGLGLGVTAVDFDASITSLTTSERIQTDETAALPVLAARAEVELGDFSLNGFANGLTASYSDVDATFLDLDVYLQYVFQDLLNFHGGVQLGYRHVVTDVEYRDGSSTLDADLTFSGPYFGLTLGI